MHFIVQFEDNTDTGENLRQQFMSAHLAFLTQKAELVVAAGPLFDTEGDPAGGLWIVTSKNESTVHELVKQDPFWPTGLRKSYRVLQWKQVFAEGRSLIEI